MRLGAGRAAAVWALYSTFVFTCLAGCRHAPPPVAGAADITSAAKAEPAAAFMTPPKSREPAVALPPLKPAPALLPVVTGKPPRYRIIALPRQLDPDGTLALNDRGEIAGRVVTNSGETLAEFRTRAAVWKRRLRLLPTLGEPREAAAAINNEGVVAGEAGRWSEFPGGDSGSNAVLWPTRGRPVNLGTLPDLSAAFAGAVNTRRLVVGLVGPGTSGEIDYADGEADGRYSNAFFWVDGKIHNLGGGSANDVNERGQIVGTAQDQAVLWQPGQKRYLGRGTATAVNNRGQIVGATAVKQSIEPQNHSTAAVAFLIGYGTRRDLVLPGFRFSQATDINDRGQTVGYGENDSYDENAHAALWQNGVACDLNRRIPPRSGWLLRHAEAINNRGQIVGTGIWRGKPRAYLLTPMP